MLNQFEYKSVLRWSLGLGALLVGCGMEPAQGEGLEAAKCQNAGGAGCETLARLDHRPDYQCESGSLLVTNRQAAGRPLAPARYVFVATDSHSVSDRTTADRVTHFNRCLSGEGTTSEIQGPIQSLRLLWSKRFSEDQGNTKTKVSDTTNISTTTEMTGIKFFSGKGCTGNSYATANKELMWQIIECSGLDDFLPAQCQSDSDTWSECFQHQW